MRKRKLPDFAEEIRNTLQTLDSKVKEQWKMGDLRQCRRTLEGMDGHVVLSAGI